LIKNPSELPLFRFPPSKDKSLKAWNAADEYLLYHLEEAHIPIKNILIVNDQFGALTTSLIAYSPCYWTDSFLAETAISDNLYRLQSDGHINAELIEKVTTIKPQYQIQPNNDVIENQQVELASQPFDLVVMRIPKHNSLLELQLTQLKKWISPDAKIIAGGMNKEVHNSTLDCFEKIIGTTKTSLSRKKARLVFSTNQDDTSHTIKANRYTYAPYDLKISSLPGVFSANKLDIGTRVLLNYLPENIANKKCIDLGCGNGIIGAVIAKQSTDNHVLLTDESALAIESARINFLHNKLNNGEFIQTHSLSGIEDRSFDYVFCNPPFHQNNTQTLSIASAMFKDAAHVLNQNGEFWVVANRHLPYYKMLQQHFNQVDTISSDPKFVVRVARRPKT